MIGEADFRRYQAYPGDWVTSRRKDRALLLLLRSTVLIQLFLRDELVIFEVKEISECENANLFDVDRPPLEARCLNVGRHVGDLVPDLGEFLTTKPRRRKHGRKRAPLGFPDAFEGRLAQHEL